MAGKPPVKGGWWPFTWPAFIALVLFVLLAVRAAGTMNAGPPPPSIKPGWTLDAVPFTWPTSGPPLAMPDPPPWTTG